MTVKIIANDAVPRGCILVHPDDFALLQDDARERKRFDTARTIGDVGRLLGLTEQEREADVIPLAPPPAEEPPP